MHPRLPSSVKWTALPKELVDQVRQIFKEAFTEKLSQAKLIVEGRIYPEELLLRVGYLRTNTIRQANFEVSIAFNPKKQNALKEIHFAIDIAASMMDEYFNQDSINEFPLHWQKFEAQGKEAYIQVSTMNTELEAQADALLGELDDSLIQHSDAQGSMEEVKAMLGVNDAEPDDDDEPTKH